MKKIKTIKLSPKIAETQTSRLEFYNGLTWQILTDKDYVDNKALQTCWDLLNDNTEVIWQPL
ncbi:MAG: hypothetical protein ACO3UU_17065 [Minisyncoccia bacterium]